MEEHKTKRQPSERQIRWAQHGVVTGLFLLAFLLVGVLCNLLTPDRETSSAENRKLAQRPEFSLSGLTDGSYFSAWDTYTADQFPGRDGWISLNFRLSKLMGAKEAGGVLLCADNYLMEPPATPNEAALAQNMQAVNEFAARHTDLSMNMTVVPNAAYILKDKLPRNVPVRDQYQDLVNLANQLQGVSFLDVTNGLLSHTDEQLFYRTDHHWTSLGAYYAFLEMAPWMGIETIHDFDVMPVSNSFEGTLASRSGCHAVADVVELFVARSDVQYYVTLDGERKSTMYDKSKLEDRDQYAVFLGGNWPRLDITTTADTDRVLLVFKDSYANSFMQFLIPNFSRIIMLDPRYYYGDADSVVSQEGVTDVLFLYNANTFFEDQVLAETLAPPETVDNLDITLPGMEDGQSQDGGDQAQDGADSQPQDGQEPEQ